MAVTQKPFVMSDFDSKVILVGLKSDLKNDEETKKKLAEKEKVSQLKNKDKLFNISIPFFKECCD